MPIISFIIQWDKSSYELDLNKIISALPLPDVVIFIEADVNIVVDRYENRGGVKIHGKRERYPVKKDAKLYRRFLLGHNVLLGLQDVLKKKKCTVITINNNNVECEEITHAIFHKLIARLNSVWCLKIVVLEMDNKRMVKEFSISLYFIDIVWYIKIMLSQSKILWEYYFHL